MGSEHSFIDRPRSWAAGYEHLIQNGRSKKKKERKKEGRKEGKKEGKRERKEDGRRKVN